ncbi:hypothetical protein EVAR_15990_1 [Eumeta japonica]|uniref:Uncharacterized protein n=1 Tax=Eumeta variegata TaxID=151549 RepID=A0A4C1UM93_EUMVA|nr:hypothetical protein EVAR_15990_1 [Eumeta japonica]
MYITNCPETLLIFLVISLAEASPWTVSNPEDVIADSSQIEVSYEPVQDVRSYQYAWSYPYYRRPRDTYMEKKVYETVARGGVYIEGLRSALQAAVDELQNCSGLYLKETTDTPVVACRALTRRNQRARRLAQLALWAARQIRQEPHGEVLAREQADK